MKPVKKPILYEDISYQVIGICYSIHKELGSHHKEHVYKNALSYEFTNKLIPFQTEVRLPVLFKKIKVGIYIPDVIVDNKIIVELKAVEVLPNSAGTQLNYYLKTTGFKVGLIINFGSERLQIRRRIYG